MSRYIGKRLVLMLVTLWVISTLTFVLMHSIPGDPFSSEKKLPKQTLENLKAKYHLDEPLPVQYVLYMKNLVMFDLGVSIKSETRTVNEYISDGFPVSAELGAYSMILALVLGIGMGVLAAFRQNKLADYNVMVLAVLGLSVPSFVIAPFFQKWFGGDWLPLMGWGDFKHAILPAVALSFLPLALVTRLMRSSMLEVMGQDYIRTARSKGLPPWRVITRHTLRNAIMPVVTIIGPLAVGILTGSFVIEHIFSIPGIGKYFVDSVLNRDYSLIMGITIFYSALLILVNFLVDLAYGLIDPRIKVGGKEAN
ncbi:peptide/nickel transport system permease protein/oligopeptide transport system permease protein [Melghirimyces profundicolus]|uniref:Peptide/nickel transport system permease protein/oligopeptide transport system permease protein n=1 Tax=Melghirimyces profundicolus TaxID=1242148 RepID=A0A2T6BTB3_9BACL|nr:ABC transporter permease [Melghirimyces profundicolus]PTX59330.1 peptide/nickel transport system permease protein/oligopeptide transport system permease protein [Melghirimyces profundicolus]